MRRIITYIETLEISYIPSWVFKAVLLVLITWTIIILAVAPTLITDMFDGNPSGNNIPLID